MGRDMAGCNGRTGWVNEIPLATLLSQERRFETHPTSPKKSGAHEHFFTPGRQLQDGVSTVRRRNVVRRGIAQLGGVFKS